VGLRRPRLSDVLLVAAGLVVLGGAFAYRANDVHLQTVLSGSMRPVAQPGDLAITAGVPMDSVGPGDVIVFYPPGQTQAVMHRIVTREGNVITTKGDANNVADPWQATLQGNTAYRLVFVVPYLGWLTEVRSLLMIGAGLVVLLLILLEIRKGVRTRRVVVAS